MLAYVQKKLQKSGNRAAEAVLCCLSCFFWCLEKCIKFINKNAYIQVRTVGVSWGSHKVYSHKMLHPCIEMFFDKCA